MPGSKRAATFSLLAAPVALMARDGEAWVLTADGKLSAVDSLAGITESLGGLEGAAAIALASSNAWIAAVPDRLIRINRYLGETARYAIGAGPIAVALGLPAAPADSVHFAAQRATPWPS